MDIKVYIAFLIIDYYDMMSTGASCSMRKLEINEQAVFT
jgi:hypothetical protein